MMSCGPFFWHHMQPQPKQQHHSAASISSSSSFSLSLSLSMTHFCSLSVLSDGFPETNQRQRRLRQRQRRRRSLSLFLQHCTAAAPSPMSPHPALLLATTAGKQAFKPRCCCFSFSSHYKTAVAERVGLARPSPLSTTAALYYVALYFSFTAASGE